MRRQNNVVWHWTGQTLALLTGHRFEPPHSWCVMSKVPSSKTLLEMRKPLSRGGSGNDHLGHGSHKDTLHDDPRWERQVAHDSHTRHSTSHMHHWIKHDRGRTRPFTSAQSSPHAAAKSRTDPHLWGVPISTLISAVINKIRVVLAILTRRAGLKYLPMFLEVLIHCKCVIISQYHVSKRAKAQACSTFLTTCVQTIGIWGHVHTGTLLGRNG